MNRHFHPWLAELRELGRARLRRAWRHRWETLFHLLAWSALAGVLVWGWTHVDGDRAGVVLHLLLQQAWLPVLLSAVLGWGAANGVGRALMSEWQEGWWNATPVAEAATSRTLRIMAFLGAVAMLAVLAGVLLALASVASHWRTWLVPALTCVAIGVPLGGLAAMLRSPRAFAAESRKPRARAVDKPLFALPMLEWRGLPHLAAWQRREALRVWRHGGRFWPFLGLGLIVPMGSAGWSLFGLLLFGLSLIWFGLALRAAQDVISRADALMRAEPLPFTSLCKATLRYPLWAWLVTCVLGSVGLLLQDARPLAAAFFAIGALLALGLQLVLSWRYRRAPWRARLRLAADASVLLVLLYLAGPLALVAYAAIVGRHFFLARKLP